MYIIPISLIRQLAESRERERKLLDALAVYAERGNWNSLDNGDESLGELWFCTEHHEHGWQLAAAVLGPSTASAEPPK